MVLDVAGALILSAARASELAEDGLVGFANDVAQNVETTAMGHANDDVLDTIVDAAIDEGLHAGDQGLAAFEAETLVVGIFGSKERLEARAPDEAIEHTALFVDRVAEGLRYLEALAQPIALFAVRNVNEFDAVGAAVDLLAGSDNLTEGHLVASLALEAREDSRPQVILGVEILLSELIMLKREFLGLDIAKPLRGSSDAERIDVGLVVAPGLVRANQELDLKMIGDVRAIIKCKSTREARHAACHAGDKIGWRLEGLGDGHLAALHVLEVDLPRDVDTLGVLLPLHVHLVDIVGGATREEVVARVGGGLSGARIASSRRQAQWPTDRRELLP